MKTWILLSILLSATSVFAADIYKTVDENGRVIYSDKPLDKKSSKMKLPELNSMAPTEVSKSRGNDVGKSVDGTDEKQAPTGYVLDISAPEPEAHITAEQRDVSVQVAIEPALYESHRIVILDNGTVIDGAVIKDILRGTHQIQAQVIDQDGRILGTSNPVTIYVHRPTVKK